MKFKPDIIAGFTALLPSYKRYRLDPSVKDVIGEPHLLYTALKNREKARNSGF